MKADLALAIVNIQMIPTLRGDVRPLVKWILSVRAEAKRTGDWPAELDDQARSTFQQHDDQVASRPGS